MKKKILVDRTLNFKIFERVTCLAVKRLKKKTKEKRQTLFDSIDFRNSSFFFFFLFGRCVGQRKFGSIFFFIGNTKTKWR